jgi:2-amino-4-hydroxy-6-hydroxymethyldihydropteridine diphosphokinase
VSPGASGEQVFLGLGGNIGDPLETLAAAVFAIDDVEGVEVEEVSSVYRTPPWPPPDDPRSVPQDDYLNLVVRLRTTLEPEQLLAQTRAIERAFGRDRRRDVRWGPRTLDIDVLLFGDREIGLDELQVPHPRMTERAFVLVPLMEVFPGGALPDGRRVARLAQDVDGLDQIDLVCRLEDVPTEHLARPEGPVGPPPAFERPAADDLAREHGSG